MQKPDGPAMVALAESLGIAVLFGLVAYFVPSFDPKLTTATKVALSTVGVTSVGWLVCIARPHVSEPFKGMLVGILLGIASFTVPLGWLVGSSAASTIALYFVWMLAAGWPALGIMGALGLVAVLGRRRWDPRALTQEHVPWK